MSKVLTVYNLNMDIKKESNQSLLYFINKYQISELT